MKNIPEILKDEVLRKRLAKAIALSCFRNSILEDFHSGITPSSKTGDYSDVRVVSQYNDIPWTRLSRIDDCEMKELMIDVVNRTYTMLTNLSKPEYLKMMTATLGEHDVEPDWDEPKLRYPEIVRMPGNYDTTVDELDPREPVINEMRNAEKYGK